MSIISLTNFTGGEISPILSGRSDMEIYSSSCARMENFIPLVHGPVRRRSGFRFIAMCRNYMAGVVPVFSDKVRLIPYSYSSDISYIIEMGSYYFRVLTEKGIVTYPQTSNPVLIETPYEASELFSISFAQSGTDLYLAHKDHEPMIISLKDGQWTFKALKYNSEALIPTMRSVQIKLTDNNIRLVKKAAYAVSAVDKKGRISAMSTPSEITSVPAKCDYENYIYIAWDMCGDDEFMVYQIMDDTPAYIGRTKLMSLRDMGLLEPDYTKLPPENIHHFTEKNNYPSKVAFFDGRLVFAGSNNEPNTVWGSVAGDYSYFAARKVPTDACAWKFTLDSGQINKIMWMLPASKLLIGTSGAEWRMSGNGGGTITPSSVEARRESSLGSSEVRAIIVGQDTIFVDRSGKNIRTFRYANESAGYSSSNLSLYAEHLTRKTSIKDWDYASVPHSIIWSVTDDGALLGLTYDAAQRVCAWHRHTTDGLFESVAVMNDKGRDLLFVVVKRMINGKECKYIEVMEEDFTGENLYSDESQAFFVDSGLTYNGSPTKNITGLSHLKGKTVSIQADGAVHPMRKVSASGSITLDYPASNVKAGLQYDSILQTMPVESMLTDGASAGRSKRISEINVRLENTVGLIVGTDMKDLIRIPFRDSYTPMGSAPKLFSGDKKIVVKGGYDASSSVIVMQDQPLPMTVVAIFPRIRYGTK